MCKEDKTIANFIGIKNHLLSDTFPICRSCIAKEIDSADEKKRWNTVNKLCQIADLPFIPEEFEKIYKANKDNAFGTYCQIFRDKRYETLNWTEYNEAYLQLQEEERVEDALPQVKDKQIRDLQAKWGSNYDFVSLQYLENLYNGIVETSGVVGALNNDQILKLCKLSLIIEEKLRAGMDIDKEIKTFDTLSKLAGITTQSSRNANEINSTGELMAYLEKQGFKPHYWHGEVNDEIDKQMKVILYWGRYMYINEDGITEEINERINNLKVADSITGEKFDWNEYKEFVDELPEEEEFEVDI